jgi:hypothetical protein
VWNQILQGGLVEEAGEGDGLGERKAMGEVDGETTGDVSLDTTSGVETRLRTALLSSCPATSTLSDHLTRPPSITSTQPTYQNRRSDA